MEKLKNSNEESLQSYSESALNMLIEKLKKKHRSYEIKKLKLFPSGMEKDAVRRLTETRKKDNPL